MMPVLDYQGDNRKNKEWNTSIIKLHSFRYRRRSSPRYVQIATSHTLVQVPSPHSSAAALLLALEYKYKYFTATRNSTCS